MEEARRKLRICLFLVVVTAVLVGLVYYFGDVRSNDRMSEGTLVMRTDCGYEAVETSAPGR